MLDVEVIGADGVAGVPSESEIQRLCDAAASAAGLADGHRAADLADGDRAAELADGDRAAELADGNHAVGLADGHLAVEFVDAARIATLNERYRGISKPTDVLSFPIDELEAQPGVERELGDVVICPEHTEDLREAIVHGVLHLLGMDHETDDGEMLALQAEILADVRDGASRR